MTDTQLTDAQLAHAAGKAGVALDVALTLTDRSLATADEALGALLTAKPYLAGSASDGRPAGTIDQGANAEGGAPDYRTMSSDDFRAALRGMGAGR